MAKKETLFSGSLFGYNKGQVEQYLQDLTHQYEDEIEELKKSLTDAEQSKTQALNDVSEAQQKLQEVTKQGALPVQQLGMAPQPEQPPMQMGGMGQIQPEQPPMQMGVMGQMQPEQPPIQMGGMGQMQPEQPPMQMGGMGQMQPEQPPMQMGGMGQIQPEQQFGQFVPASTQPYGQGSMQIDNVGGYQPLSPIPTQFPQQGDMQFNTQPPMLQPIAEQGNPYMGQNTGSFSLQPPSAPMQTMQTAQGQIGQVGDGFSTVNSPSNHSGNFEGMFGAIGNVNTETFSPIQNPMGQLPVMPPLQGFGVPQQPQQPQSGPQNPPQQGYNPFVGPQN